MRRTNEEIPVCKPGEEEPGKLYRLPLDELGEYVPMEDGDLFYEKYKNDDSCRFSFIEGNRPYANTGKHKNLDESINKDGFNPSYPLQISADRRTTMGQHRLQICKKYRIEPIYSVTTMTSYDFMDENYMLETNTTSPHGTIAVVEYYSNYKKNTNYTRILEIYNSDISRELGLSINAVINCMYGSHLKGKKSPVQKGKAIVSENDKSKTISLFYILKEFKPLFPLEEDGKKHFWDRVDLNDFYKAIRYFHSNQDRYDLGLLKEQLKRHAYDDDLKPRGYSQEKVTQGIIRMYYADSRKKGGKTKKQQIEEANEHYKTYTNGG